MKVGRIAAIYRYPVKSMAGESLQEVSLSELGIPGDRAWAVRDEARGGIRGAKKIAGLMRCSARYLETQVAGSSAAAEITLPDGGCFLSTDDDAGARISAAVGHDVTLWPLLPADALDHYRRGAPDDPDMEKELRAIFGRLPDEPLPDLGKFPAEMFQYESPPGTYFDAFPLLLLTDASLRYLQKAAPDSVIDVRRFRPNFLIETSGENESLPESGWEGHGMRIGDASVSVTIECPRCVMTTHGFDDLPEDSQVMRALVRAARGNLGAYACVEQTGSVRVGDPVELLDAARA